MRSLVVALGGNALLPPSEGADLTRMQRRVQETAKALAELADGDVRLVVTHGNGPQVGHLLAQTEEARGRAPAPPSPLQQSLGNEFARRGLATHVTTIVTQVVVDRADPAFRKPTKPIGPMISTETEAMLKRARGWQLAPDPRGGWRR